MITVTFVQPNGDEYTYDAEVGDTLMDVAVDNAVDGIIASVVVVVRVVPATPGCANRGQSTRAGHR